MKIGPVEEGGRNGRKKGCGNKEDADKGVSLIIGRNPSDSQAWAIRRDEVLGPS
jgi:hypothetical protein